MKEVVIVSAVRTAIGSFGGTLKNLSATQLGAIAIKEAIKKATIEPKLVQDVLMGCVLQANLGQAPASLGVSGQRVERHGHKVRSHRQKGSQSCVTPFFHNYLTYELWHCSTGQSAQMVAAFWPPEAS